MKWSNDECYRAVQSRDSRFDGQFFTCVRTTRIYCRPICPTRPPHARNCLFTSSAAQAEMLGFRPCLRCRPELAPQDQANGHSAVELLRARIDETLLIGHSLSQASSDLGLSERHLRRLFNVAYGVDPRQYLLTRRLLFAKQLLQDTALPIFDIALAAGFNTPGRLTINMRESYGMTPQQLRREAPSESIQKTLILKAAFRPPFEWDLLLKILAARATPYERVATGSYFRLVGTHEVGVSRDAGSNRLLIELPTPLFRESHTILHKVRRLFDLDAQPDAVRQVLELDARLKPLLEQFPGIRVPGCWDPFELLVRVILNQQISVAAATTIMARLVNEFGCTPETLSSCTEDRLTQIGITRSRASTIQAASRAILEGTVDLATTEPDQFYHQLLAIPGIGPWTAEYLRLRVLRWPDAFPAEDLAIQKALRTRSKKELLAIAESWRPWRGYATMLLWQASSAAGG